MKKITDIDQLCAFLDGVKVGMDAIRECIEGEVHEVGIDCTDTDIDCLREELCLAINSYVLRLLKDKEQSNPQEPT